MKRAASLLRDAEQIMEERSEKYGEASVSFSRIAKLWTPILKVDVTPTQVALCMCQLKVSRLISDWDEDSVVDLINYAALAHEVENNVF